MDDCYMNRATLTGYRWEGWSSSPHLLYHWNSSEFLRARYKVPPCSISMISSRPEEATLKPQNWTTFFDLHDSRTLISCSSRAWCDSVPPSTIFTAASASRTRAWYTTPKPPLPNSIGWPSQHTRRTPDSGMCQLAGRLASESELESGTSRSSIWTASYSTATKILPLSSILMTTFCRDPQMHTSGTYAEDLSKGRCKENMIACRCTLAH